MLLYNMSSDNSSKLFFPDALKKEIELLMHPEKDKSLPKISFIFSFDEEDESREETIKRISEYKNLYSFTRNRKIFYKVDFNFEEAKLIHMIYNLIDSLPHKEILINDLKLPYAGSLWLPLLWFYL